MAQPDAYNRRKDFSQEDGDATDNQAINQELDAAGRSINQLRTNIARIQADDGNLKAGSVGVDQLKPDAFDAFKGGLNAAVNRAQSAAVESTRSAAASEESARRSDGSAENAARSENNATQAARNSASAAKGMFDGIYLGARSTDPVVDGNGQPLKDGVFYYNNVAKLFRSYDIGTNLWVNATPSGQFKRVEFVAGAGFVPGTTRRLTLGSAPGTAANVFASFDGVVQHHSKFTVSGKDVVFGEAIPVGVSAVDVWYLEAIVFRDLPGTSDSLIAEPVWADVPKEDYANEQYNDAFNAQAQALANRTEYLKNYKQDAPSARTRDAKEFFRENWTIKDFGNAGFGGDWTDAFLKIASEVDEGQHIKLLDNEYFIEENVTYARDGLKFQGYGPSHSVIKRAPGLSLDQGEFRFEACSDIRLSGFSLDGNKVNNTNPASGLVFRSQGGGVVGAVLDDMVFSNWGQSTMDDFAAGFVAYGAKEMRIKNSYATGNAHYGFNFFECTDVIAAMLFSIGNGSHGFGAAGLINFNFVGLHAKNNRRQGFWLRNIEDGTLTGCSATWSFPSAEFIRRGLQIKGTASEQEAAGNNRVRNVAVEGFICRGALDTLTTSSESAAIYMHSESGGTLSGVNIKGGVIDDCGYGALLPNSEHIYIDGTLIRNPRNIGIKDDGVNHFGYNNVRVIDGRKQGIVSRGRYGDITGNKVRSRQLDATNTYSAIEYADRSDVTISDNEASSLEGANTFRSVVHLSGAYASRIRTFENRIKSTAQPVTKAADFGASGFGNADWDNFNNTGLSPYADKRFAGAMHIGDGYSEIMPGVFSGNGSPEGVVAARIGSIYMRRDGGAGTTQYVKEQFTGNTGWVAK